MKATFIYRGYFIRAETTLGHVQIRGLFNFELEHYNKKGKKNFPKFKFYLVRNRPAIRRISQRQFEYNTFSLDNMSCSSSSSTCRDSTILLRHKRSFVFMRTFFFFLDFHIRTLKMM